MRNRNISAPLTMSVVSLPGTAGSSISGAVVGTGQAGAASTNSAHELNSQHHSLFRAINVLSQAAKNSDADDMPGLNLFPEGLHDILESVRNGGASTAGTMLLTPVMLASHISQLPSDVKVSIEGLLHSIADFRPFFKTREASILDIDKELADKRSNFSANCKELCNQICDVSDKLKIEVDGQFKDGGGAAKSHAHLVKTFASSSMLATMGTAGLVSFMFDTVGALFREMSGLIEFSKMESTHPKEKNIYIALRECCASGSKGKNSIESLQALRKLEIAIMDFNPASDMSRQHALSAPGMSVFTRMITSAPFVESLLAVNSSAVALTETHHALKQERHHFYEQTKMSATLASLLNVCTGGDHHSQNVAEFSRLFDAAIAHIDHDLNALEDKKSVGSSAKATLRTDSAFIVATSLVTGLTGMISREFSGSIDFTKHDKGSKEESAQVSKSRKDMTGADLDALQSRICDLHDRLARCRDLGVSAPVSLGIAEAVTTGSLIASLNVLAGMYSALREFKTMSQSPSQAMVLDDAERVKAAHYAQSYIQCNKDSAGSSGAGSSSAHLSLHQQVESVMQKMIFIHRSKQNFSNPGVDRNDLNSAGKSSIAFSQGNSTGFLLGSFGVMLLVSLQSGIGTEAVLGALRFMTNAKRVSDGVDKSESDNGSKSNFSFLSNATRLSEDSIKKSDASKTASSATYHVLESVFSRSLTVALCQSGALTEMLRRLVKQEHVGFVHAPGFLDSIVTSDAIKPLLRDNILQVLDAAEAAHNPIPGLNDDMASSLASASKTAIATAVSEHSIFITPILKSIVASRKASVIADDVKNEAVTANSELSRIISTSLNQMQAFTANFMDEVVKINNPLQHSSLADSSDAIQARSLSVSSAVTLFCDELFEICISRALTLLDMEKVAETIKETRENTQHLQQISSQAMTEDSAFDQPSRISHVLTALRLTISHLGNSLGEFASELDSKSNLLKDNLKIHSSQQSFLKSMSSGFVTFSQALSAVSAMLSQLPVSTVGSIESLREVIHSIDQHLILKPVHSSQDSTKNSGSETTLLTGMGTDCVTSILSTVIKLLLRASIFGLDATFSVAKLLEILCVHPNPGAALSLELQAMSQPNGFSQQLSETKQNVSVSTTMGAASVCASSRSNTSMSTENAQRTLQAAVDYEIDKVAVLEDEEDTKIGLKTFFAMLVRMMNGMDTDVIHCNELVMRFHRGGIALSSYHSEHGSLFDAKEGKDKNPLIKDDHFLGCDNASAVLNTFINKAFKSKDMLENFKHELGNLENLSEKAFNCWKFIVDSVIDRLKLASTRNSIIHPDASRVSKKSLEERRVGLLHALKVEALDMVEEMVPATNDNNAPM